MNDPREVFAPRKGLLAGRAAGGGDRIAIAKRVLCVLPRRIRGNPLRKLLGRYDLTVSASRTSTLRACRQEAHDLFVIYAPLGWAEAADVCLAIRELDPNAPLIVYSTLPSTVERREVTEAGAAYVGPADDEHNLDGTAGQLIMLAELRSMEALATGSRALEDDLVRRLARSRGKPAAPSRRIHRLKLAARRLFADAGGSRANFERVWPALYEAALRRLRDGATS